MVLTVNVVFVCVCVFIQGTGYSERVGKAIIKIVLSNIILSQEAPSVPHKSGLYKRDKASRFWSSITYTQTLAL